MASLNNMVEMLREYAFGAMVDREAVLALGRANPEQAVQAFRHVFHEAKKNKPIRPGLKLLDFMWALRGCQECVGGHFLSVPDGMYAVFVREELRLRPEQFTEKELNHLSMSLRDESVRAAIKQARLSLAQREAQELLQESHGSSAKA